MKVAIVFLCAIACSFAATIDPLSSWRIVGGQTATSGQFPYQISMRYYGSHSCGGSILDATTILCAAHCIDGVSASALTVVVGVNKLNERGESHKVDSIIGHSGYNSRLIKNDISILKLATPIQFNEKVQPVKLPSSNIGAGETVTLSGWGRTSYPGSIPNDLQYINLNTITSEDCHREHQSGTGLPVDGTQVCTYTQVGQGACHGDSGGPLVNSNGEQIGIVSWGYPCARGKPDVFTRVWAFMDWISQNRN